MSTDYTADPTATQAPSARPAPEAVPILTMPDDGEDADADSIRQFVKSLGDHVAWLFKPTAKIADWAKWIMAWRRASGHKALIVDHFGLPAGQVQSFREDWNLLTLSNLHARPSAERVQLGIHKTGSDFLITGAGVLPRWYMFGDGTDTGFSALNASINTLPPGSARKVARQVVIRSQVDLNAWASLNTEALCRYDADLAVALSWDAAVNPDSTGMLAGIEDGHFYMGFLDNVLSPGAANNQSGAWFEKVAGTPNWLCSRQTVAGGAITTVDSGVAVDLNWHRFRIVWVGANADDSGASRLLYFIDGVLVANVTTALPTDKLVRANFMHLQTTSVTDRSSLSIGPLVFGANHKLDALE